MKKYCSSVGMMAALIVLAAGTSMQPRSTHASVGTKKSLHEWAVCNGVADDTDNVKKALAAAKNSAFTLIVDCSARLVFGMDISRSIFIDNGTTIEFTEAGKFTIDNVMIPAFVIANTSDVSLTDWNVEYDAGLPISGDVRGYVQHSEFFPAAGSVQPAGAFNDFTLPEWLEANRGIMFERTNSLWRGGIVPMATVLFSGDASNVRVTGMHLYVPSNAGGNRFIPVAFGFSPNYKSNQRVYATTPIDAQHIGVPHDITFSGITLDGTYFGWLGNAQHVVFENITSHRYGDLQDANGLHVGGVGKWFAPPHLFYLNYDLTKDSALFNTDLQIKNVVDDGPRVGTARDKGGSDTSSGYANSLKIGCIDCIVDTYASTRPDGFMDVLPSSGLVISNVTSTYDSEFLHGLYPSWRFPTDGYTNLTFENMSLSDSAARSVRAPIGSASSINNKGIVFTNVQQRVNHWVTAGLMIPDVVGSDNDVSVKFAESDLDVNGTTLELGDSAVTLQAGPTTVKKGQTTKLTWVAKEASSCNASGAWSGSLRTEGSRVVTVPQSPGSESYTIRCQNSRVAYSTSVKVIVE